MSRFARILTAALAIAIPRSYKGLIPVRHIRAPAKVSKRTQADLMALAAAQAKRDRKAAKRKEA